MLNKLIEFAHGKIVMALEGGYNPDALANSVLACVKVLLDNKPIIGSCEAYPFESTWRVIQKVRRQLSPFWPILADELPKKLTSCKAPLGWRAALLEDRTPSNSVMWGKDKRLLSDNEEEYEDVEGGEGEAREEKKDKEPEVLSKEQVGEEGDGLLFMLCLQDLLFVLQNVHELYYRSQRMAEDLKGKNVSLEQTTRDLNLRTKELEELKTQLATTISNAAKFEAAMKEAEAELQRFRELMNTAEANLTKAEADLAAEQAMSKLLHDEMAKAHAEMETKLKAENDKGYNEGEAETLPECLKQIQAIEDASYKQGQRAALKLIRAIKDASYKQGWRAALLVSGTPSNSVLWGKDKRPLSDDEDVEGGEDEAREENNQGLWFLHPWTQVLGLH